MNEAISKGVLKAMLIIGAAQGINLLVSIMRTKVIALLMGPSGIGLLGVLNNLVSMSSQLAGLGIGTSGVREIAANEQDTRRNRQVASVLLYASLFQGLVALIVMLYFRIEISLYMFGDSNYQILVAAGAISVCISLLASAQLAILQGLRCIPELGKTAVYGALFSTLAGLPAVYIWGDMGLGVFVVVQPLITALVSFFYLRGKAFPEVIVPNFSQFKDGWIPMVRLGLAFMLSGVLTSVSLLILRTHIVQFDGIEVSGQFSASWSISIIYVGFLLNSMSADYFPRLTEVIGDEKKSVELINNQIQLILALAGPIVLVLIAFPHEIIHLMYSPSFTLAGDLLKWQALGNVLKLVCWALGFAIAALGRGRLFFIVEMQFNAFLLGIYISLRSELGVMAVGPAFALTYAFHFAFLMFLVRRILNFQFDYLSLVLLSTLSIGSVVSFLAVEWMSLAGQIFVVVGALIFGIFSTRIVLYKVGPSGKAAKKLFTFFNIIGWPLAHES